MQELYNNIKSLNKIGLTIIQGGEIVFAGSTELEVHLNYFRLMNTP